MNDHETTLAALKERVRVFSQERAWEQFHYPKDLGLALACEVGELLEHFRYRTDAQIQERLQSPDEKQAIGHELADCLWLLLRLSDVCGIDLSDALHEKVDLAALKYPIDKVYGRPDKYTAYQVDVRKDNEG